MPRINRIALNTKEKEGSVPGKTFLAEQAPELPAGLETCDVGRLGAPSQWTVSPDCKGE